MNPDSHDERRAAKEGDGSLLRAPVVLVILALGLGLAPTACAAAPRIGFDEVSAQAGLTFRHTIGDREMSSLVEATGAGCALLDFDQDGWLDIFLVTGCHLTGLSDPTPDAEMLKNATDRLYRNRRDGTFEDVTKQAGILPGGYGIGVLAGDYDNDGYPDIYVTHYGTNRLYHNNRNGTFTECARAAGVAEAGFSVGACFLDYDNDGHLDLFVGGYVAYDDAYNRSHGKANSFPGPLAYPPTLSQLYRNLGNGTFTNVTATAGLKAPGRAMGVGSFDYDGDGWPDIFVSNDAMENHLLHNLRNGTFKEEALMAGVALGAMGETTGAMAVETGDVNGDERIDLYVPDFTQSCLYLNLGKGLFDNQTLASGITRAVGDHIQWGAALADFDLDGTLDLYVSRGDANSLTGYPDRVLLNNGQARFTDVSNRAGPWFTQAKPGRGVARGDFDNDGLVDLLVVNLNDTPALLHNISPRQDRHWLILNLVGHASNRDAVGARLRCVLPGGIQVRERVSGGSYCSSHDPRVHFGLGTAASVPELEIRWPSRTVQTLTNVKADQILTVEEPVTVPTGEAQPPAPPAAASKPNAPDAGGPELELMTMLRHAVPGEPHVLLNRLIGQWTTRTRYWMKAGTEPVEAAGSSTRRWILDGRFLLEELDGGDLGLPFRAMAIFGYDAFEQKYTSAWVDTTSTAILTYLGTYDATNNVVDFAGQYKDPWTGARKKNRGLTRFLAPNRVVLELHVTEPDGQEFKMLEITYTRKGDEAAPPRPNPGGRAQ